MQRIWDKDEQQFIESWMFPEWWYDKTNKPIKETLEIIKELQYDG